MTLHRLGSGKRDPECTIFHFEEFTNWWSLGGITVM
jgi:hypothetical protein